jgi:hypothetical protein
VPSPVAAAVPGGVSCMSAAACMAAGEPNGPGAQLWNGHRWIPQVIPTPRGIVPYRRNVPFLGGISCPAARRCVGLASVRTGYGSSAELTATWNGRKWTSAPILGACDCATGVFLSGISCPSVKACVAVGGNSINPIAAFWNGRTWALQTLPEPADEPSASLYELSCDTATSCMALGSSGNEVSIILDDPLAERYRG